VNVPTDLKYTSEHEWVKVEAGVATIGITDWAQGELGDIVFVELSDVDTSVDKMGAFGTIEAVKAVSELYLPIAGKIIEINSLLEDDPMIVNRDPYGDGWMIKIEIVDSDQIDELLDAVDYEKLIDEQ